jgi:type VI secretion system protein ImpM
MDNMSTPGFYGKCPCRGDFITRDLPKEFVQRWDKWLQNSLAESREQLTDAWTETYLVSPIWHFMLSANLCGPNAWLGLIMPNVDKVGRYFPLTLALQLPFQISASHLGDEAISDWFERADDLALSTLEEHFELPQFEQELLHLGVPVISETMIAIQAKFLQISKKREKATCYMPLSEQNDFQAFCQKAENYQSAWKTYSFWWTGDTEEFQRTMLFCEGLPPQNRFVAFLDGQWQRWGWSSI